MQEKWCGQIDNPKISVAYKKISSPTLMIKYYFECVDKIQSNASDKPYYLVVFPEKRTVEMGETICQLHGGHLPVPTNPVENEVRQTANIVM